jgi:phage terminase large subunit GpA-like protein
MAEACPAEDVAFWRDVFSIILPPPAVDVDQWADQYRKIPVEFASAPGDWQTARVACMREVMKAASPAHPCKRVVLVKPVQAGGTEALVLNVIGHAIHLNPRSMIVTFPTIDLAESFSKERLEPMIRLVPALNERVADVVSGPTVRERSSVKSKRYPGGFLILTGANSISGLSSRAVPLVIMDETDACISNAGPGGNPARLLAARATTFSDRKEIYLSSPMHTPEESGILQMWENSSKGQLETACPACGGWQVLAWERMDLDKALLACLACGVYSGQGAWQAGAVRWVHAEPEHYTQGFCFTGLNSPWLAWGRDICAPFKEASRLARLGDDSLLRVFYNTKLARSYRPAGKRVEADLYRERREVYAAHVAGAEIPVGVILLTAAVDVQDSYLSYEVVGWGKFKESWGIEAGDIRGDPRAPGGEVWQALDKFVYNRLFRHEDGRLARARLVFIDSGGHATSEVYRYCRGRQPRVFAIKGVGGTGKPIIIGGRSRERSEGAWLLRLGVDTLKDEFHGRLAVAEPGPGYCHFPRLANSGDVAGYSQTFFDQLVAEERTLKYTAGGFARYTWAKARSAQNEAFDTRCYNRAALEYLKARLEAMPRDVLANLAPDAIEEIELGFGRRIVNLKPGTKAGGAAAWSSAGTTTAAIGAETPQQPTGPRVPPEAAWGAKTYPSAPRYGASGSSF